MCMVIETDYLNVCLKNTVLTKFSSVVERVQHAPESINLFDTIWYYLFLAVGDENIGNAFKVLRKYTLILQSTCEQLIYC